MATLAAEEAKKSWSCAQRLEWDGGLPGRMGGSRLSAGLNEGAIAVKTGAWSWREWLQSEELVLWCWLSWFEEQMRDDAGFQNVPCSSGGQLALVGFDSCSLFPRPGHYRNKAALGAGALMRAGWRPGRPPAAGKAGPGSPESIDGPMIGKISTPCRLRTSPVKRASSPVLVPVSEFS